MDNTILAVLITAGLGLIGSWLAVHQARQSEAEKAEIARNTNDVEMTKVQIDGWHRFVESYRVENERLNAQVKEERAIAQSFADRAERLEQQHRELEAEVAWCRSNHPPRGSAPT